MDLDLTDFEADLSLQPENKSITDEQLLMEVKKIYAGLVLVEAKCIDLDTNNGAKSPKLTMEQWGALIALRKTLLHEHIDFFWTSKHPTAGAALSELPIEYDMAKRMWRHGIYGFLEFMRHKLPDSLDYMLQFIHFSYSMLSLLYETVPNLKDAWIVCLGDLGRYRMAIEHDNFRDRELWSSVARYWYSKAVDRLPKVCKDSGLGTTILT